MKRGEFTDEHILAIVKEGEAGRKVADLCRANGITEQRYYHWEAKYGGMALSEMQQLELEDENRRLKQIVAEQMLDPVDQGWSRKYGEPHRSVRGSGVVADARCARAAACRVVGPSPATWRYQPDPQNIALLDRLQAHATARPHFGYRRLHVLVGCDGLRVNHKRVYRLYRAAGLQVRRRRRRRLTWRRPRTAARSDAARRTVVD